MTRNRARAHPNLAVQPVRNGQGIVAQRAFAAGALVCRIEGALLSHLEVDRLWRSDRCAAANCFRFDADRYLSPRGLIGDFANHSCRPNATVKCERGRLVLRALRAIAAGDEVTHDYSTLLGADDTWTMRCNCGEQGCRGVVRRFDTLPPATLRRYRALGAIPAFIEATAAASAATREPTAPPAPKSRAATGTRPTRQAAGPSPSHRSRRRS